MSDNASLSPRERAEEALCALGFNRSAARLYLTLVEQHPATGYELSSRSGVPRAAIYHTLNQLEKDGLVSRIQENPARYQPLEPERLTALLGGRFERTLRDLQDGLENMTRAAAPAGTWNVLGYDHLIEQARLLVRGCQRQVVLSLWRREADALADDLRWALAQGKEVILFSFTSLPEDCGRVHSYGIAEADLEQHWPHKLIVVADQEAVLMGNAARDPENRAVLTREGSLVEMAVSNLILDLTLWGQRFGRDVSGVIAGLTRFLAPVEALCAQQASSVVANHLPV